MKVFLILATVIVLMDNVFANNDTFNPLFESGPAARTLFQTSMKCNTQSAYKRIQMTKITPDNANCDYTIRAYSTKVCQLRIDFFLFSLEQPRKAGGRQYAYCAGDRLSIQGLPFPLCGDLSNQHVYVPFDVQRITDTKLLDFSTLSPNSAIWYMEVNQIECGHKAALVTFDQKQAPDGCLQYFYEPISSFPVQSFNFGKVYYGDTKYAICFNRNYNQNAALELYDITFEMDGSTAAGALGFDSDCLTSLNGDPKDYIAIPFAEVIDPTNEDPHSLFCLKSLDANILTFTGTGPIVIHVNTDLITAENPPGNMIESGFSFRYRILNYYYY